MRRDRNLREHRSKLLSNRKVQTVAEKREKVNRELRHSKAKTTSPTKPQSERLKSIDKQYRAAMLRRARPAASALPVLPPIVFKPYDDYRATKTMSVCHVIESLGMGGAQTMMFELVNALTRYYGSIVQNTVVCIADKPNKLNDLCRSYCIEAEFVPTNRLRDRLVGFDVVVHHRISFSSSLDPYLSGKTKYVLINHTWHRLQELLSFRKCDAYVSVCDFLHRKTRWHHVHDSRKFTILNGVEDSFIDMLPSENLGGEFRTGRCHRMVSGKFRETSIKYIDRSVAPYIPGFRHILMGFCPNLKTHHYPWLTYLGEMKNRQRKMSIIKSLDVYFYDTYQHEGASIAVLESLACGVPVICKNLGGNTELVKDGLNGFVVGDLSHFSNKLRQLSEDSEMLADMKELTRRDFVSRLHVKNTACKYMQLFEALLT